MKNLMTWIQTKTAVLVELITGTEIGLGVAVGSDRSRRGKPTNIFVAVTILFWTIDLELIRIPKLVQRAILLMPDLSESLYSISDGIDDRYRVQLTMVGNVPRIMSLGVSLGQHPSNTFGLHAHLLFWSTSLELQKLTEPAYLVIKK